MTFLAFVFGLIIGSFLNVLIYRLPRHRGIGGRSFCPHCKHPLSSLDLFPLLSYVVLGGVCRYCKKPISMRYPLIELATGLLFAASNIYFPAAMDSVIFFRAIFIISVLVVVFMIDLERYLILDRVIFPASFALLFLNFAVDFEQNHVLANSLVMNGLIAALGLFLFFGSIYVFSKGRWIGLGDVKFALFLGLATPYPLILVNFFLSFTIGALFGIGLIIFKGKKLQSEVPFGTFLAFSTLLVLFFGSHIINWYLNLIGLGYYAKF